MNSSLGLFTECTRYNDKAASENRLTQVFAAAFNYSPTVRKTFLDLIGCNESSRDAFIATQQQLKGSSRPDMLVYLDGGLKKFIVIESKTDLKQIAKEQLDGHRFFAKKKGMAEMFVLISRYRYDVPDGWRSVLWYDFTQKLQKKDKTFPDTIDEFVCHNFIDFLKEYGYMKSTSITTENFVSASRCIKNIRTKRTPSTSVSGLIDVQNVSDFMSFCMEYVNQNSKKISDKTMRKSYSTVFGYWYERDCKDNCGLTLGIKQKINGMRNGADHIGFMMQQNLDEEADFVLSINLWRNSDFIILAEWYVKDDLFYVWKMSTKRESSLNDRLLVCDVADLAIKQWDDNYSKGAEKLGFDKHGIV